MATLFARVVQGFSRLPGLGRKSGERLAFSMLTWKEDDVRAFAETLVAFRKAMSPCRACGLLSESDPCRICGDARRQESVVCVVKDSADALAVERCGGFAGRYHVLGGLISPLEGIAEAQLSLELLENRARLSTPEIVFALDQTVEAEVTMQAVRRRLRAVPGVRFSTLATGLPTGAGLESVDGETLKSALAHRREVAA